MGPRHSHAANRIHLNNEQNDYELKKFKNQNIYVGLERFITFL